MSEFNQCTIFDCEQRSDEWFDLRKGILTASEFGPWLLKDSDKRSRDAREKAICKLVAQAAGGWEPSVFENEAMKRGTLMEPDAVAAFERWSRKKVTGVGFCRSNHGRFGCSPDGLIKGENAGFEGKVPISSTHVLYRRAGVLPEVYKYQVHGSMAVTGADAWWFQSYEPRLASFRIKIVRDSFTDELFDALCQFSRELNQAIAEESQAWELENKVSGDAA